jgi:hypothetical protein
LIGAGQGEAGVFPRGCGVDVLLANVAFGVSATVSGSIPLLYADWTAQEMSTGLILHLTVAIALGISIGLAKSDFQRLLAKVARWMVRK